MKHMKRLKYKNPVISVDVIIKYNNKIVLVKRRNEPSRDMWALPGGFVEFGEEPQNAAIREAKEETGLDITLFDSKKAWVFGHPKRDPRYPRRHVITLIFVADAKSKNIRAGDDAKDAGFFSRKEIPKRMAFDHKEIIKDVLGW